MKAPHYELQVQYLADIPQTVWGRPDYPKRYIWSVFNGSFMWLSDWEYHIGPTPPEQLKMCELGGLQFPMPESFAPEIGTLFYIARIEEVTPHRGLDDGYQINWLQSNILHLNKQAAEQHSAALRAANLQAVENAR